MRLSPGSYDNTPPPHETIFEAEFLATGRGQTPSDCVCLCNLLDETYPTPPFSWGAINIIIVPTFFRRNSSRKLVPVTRVYCLAWCSDHFRVGTCWEYCHSTVLLRPPWRLALFFRFWPFFANVSLFCKLGQKWGNTIQSDTARNSQSYYTLDYDSPLLRLQPCMVPVVSSTPPSPRPAALPSNL